MGPFLPMRKTVDEFEWAHSYSWAKLPIALNGPILIHKKSCRWLRMGLLLAMRKTVVDFEWADCYIFVPSEPLISSITIGLPRFFISIPHPLEVVLSHLWSNHVVIYDTRTCFTVLFHRWSKDHYHCTIISVSCTIPSIHIHLPVVRFTSA